MKILIISQYYFPEQFQINEIAPELVRRGHNVTVICGLPNYPKGVIFEGYEAPEKRMEVIDGVKVIRVSQAPRGDNKLQLLRNYWSYIQTSRKKVHELDGDFDVVLGYQLSPITSMYAALEYKKLYRIPVLLYTLDIWPVSAEGILKSKKNPIYPIVACISKKIYQAADRILVTSRPFIDYLHKVNVISIDRMRYLPQHASAEMLYMDLTTDNNNIADFLFAGNFGNGQHLDVIVNAAAILGTRSDYVVHMVGDGSMRQTLEQMVKEKKLQNNFIFYGYQIHQDMPQFYKKADVLLITLRGDNEVGNTMPGKLQMYMTTGKPILGAINGAANDVIQEANCGRCVNAGDYEGLAQLMRDYIEQPERYNEFGNNARQYFKSHFTIKKYMDDIENELEKFSKK